MSSVPFSVFEHAYYIGSYISGILYGANLVLYLTTLNILAHKRVRGHSDLFFALYSTALLIPVTLELACDAVWGEQMWITFRDAPGGPQQFFMTQENVWYQILSSVSVVVLVFLGDALLVYRCMIFWNDYRVILVPAIVYLTAFSLAVVQLVGAFTPGGNFFGGHAQTFGEAYYGLSIALNILLTALICARLLYLSRRVRSTLGEASARLYTGVMVLLIESAAPYTAIGIIFLAFYARGRLEATAFGKIWAKFACLSPQLIVLRVVRGRAWGSDTVSTATGTTSSFTRRRTDTTGNTSIGLRKRTDGTSDTQLVDLKTNASRVTEMSREGKEGEGDGVWHAQDGSTV